MHKTPKPFEALKILIRKGIATDAQTNLRYQAALERVARQTDWLGEQVQRELAIAIAGHAMDGHGAAETLTGDQMLVSILKTGSIDGDTIEITVTDGGTTAKMHINATKLLKGPLEHLCNVSDKTIELAGKLQRLMIDAEAENLEVVDGIHEQIVSWLVGALTKADLDD